MITVNVWFPNGRNVGHASAQIGANEYVSWWPTSSWLKKRPGVAKTLAGDIEAEGGPPNASHVVRGLDQAAAQRWWVALKSQGAVYSAARFNCAWAVITMLKAAGADERINWTRALAQYNVPLGAIVPGLCIAAGLAAIATGSAAGQVATADHCTTIWTPADAIRFARAID